MVLRNVMRHPLRAAASVFGIAFAVSILMIGFVFNDAIDRLMLEGRQINEARRSLDRRRDQTRLLAGHRR